MNKPISVWDDTKKETAEQIYVRLKSFILGSDLPALEREWGIELLEKLYKLLR